ncbi:16S rRNA (adenine(1518)-N(6)/adenine(1519)-N(6))-dimethyltransferase RsmA [Clostridium algidicarnis]|uniref:16S rRNA (adenine(1518)-N(6)/adenine(1519)-N(6))- dimethyltransferase RsmA n=1 Tax=Clostridium algidicarnis TaxID=37659 RepID=UPI001C0AE667|nr:16S rRNA (adenine(1518)-N(6)/adenine(1519)-N(6))-dimethyltransferase RsmA [Clostridium algidicarnis]MBU3196930.1 16S rRNA (adenine(1518)-N(6)/adenine(1519)-N(6))-dimethyltransferase RsmA [Clostridium algidicarnis]MBU3210400.1 16S rRNA (adenine(1518)-N(6)/adenine(1519)-N(6))-dimethyltransferase RsmA [Clostridium algidicarnis]MBU3228372.1 16S rRNA (adenine(1518)-N(6)/adenine(1519)-N(6))-dimethyltransferase RsmA [Clostridium algidicarnis]MBU3251429.1 16S rRNA (adenine(1518)-N(6)/adenine(1519)-N
MGDYRTKEIVDRYKFKFTKTLGQNFLVDDKVIEDLVNGAEITSQDFVIEIGPGVGTVTREILKKAKRVTAIEIDRDLIPILVEELREFDNFQLVHKDALKIDYNEIIGEETKVKLVANLPYYLTTPIIARLLNGKYDFQSLTVMIQKEVADRIHAKPSTKEYGSLSLLVQYYCDTSVIRTVSPTCFLPRPKVDSIIIRLDRLSKPRVEVTNEELFFKIIRSSFNMRRKTLPNGLKVLGFSKELIEEAFKSSNIDVMRRGETLSIEEFAMLANNIDELSNN